MIGLKNECANNEFSQKRTFCQVVYNTNTYIHGWKKCAFFPGTNQNFPPILLNFPPYLYVFLYFRDTNSLQISRFPWNQVPEFPIFFQACLYIKFVPVSKSGNRKLIIVEQLLSI